MLRLAGLISVAILASTFASVAEAACYVHTFDTCPTVSGPESEVVQASAKSFAAGAVVGNEATPVEPKVINKPTPAPQSPTNSPWQTQVKVADNPARVVHRE